MVAQLMASAFRDPVVCLLRALYGHPLAGEMWHQHIEKAIKNLGYESMIEWPSVYFKGFGATLILIVLYVDDLLIAAAKELAHRAFTELREYIQIGEHSDISKWMYSRSSVSARWASSLAAAICKSSTYSTMRMSVAPNPLK